MKKSSSSASTASKRVNKEQAQSLVDMVMNNGLANTTLNSDKQTWTNVSQEWNKQNKFNKTPEQFYNSWLTQKKKFPKGTMSGGDLGSLESDENEDEEEDGTPNIDDMFARLRATHHELEVAEIDKNKAEAEKAKALADKRKADLQIEKLDIQVKELTLKVKELTPLKKKGG